MLGKKRADKKVTIYFPYIRICVYRGNVVNSELRVLEITHKSVVREKRASGKPRFRELALASCGLNYLGELIISPRGADALSSTLGRTTSKL